MRNDVVVIMAAGKGVRMNSDTPKMLHKVNGATLIKNIIEQSRALGEQLVVVGHAKELVLEEIPKNVKTTVQEELLGTGDALKCALREIDIEATDSIIVLPGDHPFITEEFLFDFMKSHKESGEVITMATCKIPNYEGMFEAYINFGKVIRDENGNVKEIVELKDATEEQKKCLEVNLSYYIFDAIWLANTITEIEHSNAANEYYLTDIAKLAYKQNKKVNAYILADPREGIGINTKEQFDIARSVSSLL